MKVIITEDIVRNALNESIDEFMLEEGLKDWYNNGNGKYIKNAVNWGKNAIANYMDKRTNGEWNRKYNVYADNTGKSIRSKNKWDFYRDLYAEQNCLKEWFDSHAEYLNKILHYKEGPMRSMYGRNNFFNTNVFMGISGGTQYIQTYCTYDNFVEYAQRYFTDYQGNEFIEQYITNQIQTLADVPQKCITKLNIRSFSSSPEGDGFYNQGMDERNAYMDKKAQERSQNTEENRIGWYLSNVAKGIVETLNKKQNPEDYIQYYLTKQNFVNAFSKEYSGDDFQRNRMNLVYSWLINTLNRKIKSNGINSNIGQWLTYERFLKSQEGKQYQYLSQQQSAPTANKQ